MRSIQITNQFYRSFNFLHQQRLVGHRMVSMARLGALLGLVFLSSCTRHLNMSRIEANIQDDIERQGRRLTLKDVLCPNRVVKQAEAYIRCVGELPDGGQFTINVIQQDDQGNVIWDVPSSKVLINLASLEEKIQEDIKGAVGKRLAVDCGNTYRVNQRGDTFECDVVGAGTVSSGRVVAILVKVAGDGNLEWQEVLVGDAPAVAATTSASTAPPTKTDEEPEAETTPEGNAAATETADDAAANPVEEDDEGDRQ